MKFTKLMAVVLSLAIAATAMFTSAFAVTINGTVEEGDVTGIVIDLGADYPVLLDAASWAAGVEVDFTYDFENEIVEVVEGYGNGCGGNAGLYIKYGEGFTWKDKNIWSYDVNWMPDKDLTCNKIALTVDTAGAEIREAGFRLYNFQQVSDCDLDDQLIGNGITVEILDIRVGGVSILGDEPTTEEPTTEEPTTEEPATEEPATEEPATEEPATEEPATEEPTTEEPTTEEPAPEGAYIKATVDNAAGTVVISTVNFPANIFGLQYTVEFTGATYTSMEKAALPEGWTATYPPAITNGFTAAYDCDFTAALADQDLVTLNFTDVTNIELAFSEIFGVSQDADYNFEELLFDSLVVYVDGEPTTEEPATDTDTATEEPATDTDTATEEPATDTDTATEEPATDTDTATEEPATDAETTTDSNTELPSDDEEPGDVDTGVAGFASILGVVALAGVVASKKR